MLIGILASPAIATDHFNLERGIPTTLEDIEPVERGSIEMQGFGSLLWRLREETSRGEAEPRLVWGLFKDAQLEIAAPLLLGEGLSSGNGDIQVSLLRKVCPDRPGAWRPGIAIEADIRLPTGAEIEGADNRMDAGVDLILKKDFGPHSLHLNAGFDWTGDKREGENIRKGALSIAVGHDMPVTRRLLLVSDIVWRQPDETGTRNVWLLETGVRAQLTHAFIGAAGIGIGLNKGQETPGFTMTLGFQYSL